MKIIQILCFVLAAIGFLSNRSSITLNQGNETEVNSIYLLQNKHLYRLDIKFRLGRVVSQLTPLIDVEAAQTEKGRRLWAADIDNKGLYLYQIETWGYNTNPRLLGSPIGGELIRIAIATKLRESIFSRAAVSNFILSPDNQRIVIVYYTGEYLYSLQNACVLDLQSMICSLLDFKHVGLVTWLDNENILISASGVYPLHIVHASTGATQDLISPSEWQLHWGTLIPGTRSLLVSAKPYRNALQEPVHFLIYNMDSEMIKFQSLEAPKTSAYLRVNALRFSPTGEYLLYQGSKTALVNFKSGKLIQEFDSVYSTGWIGEATLIVQGVNEFGHMEILHVDALSGQVTTLHSGETAEGLLMFSRAFPTP